MNQHLTEDKIAEYREAFKIYDKNGDGSISINELSDMLKNLGMEYTDEELKELVREVDLDNNGNIDFREFMHLMTIKFREFESEEELIEAFKVFDRDGNGYITAIEFKQVIFSLGEVITDEELNEMVAEADIDGDGFIDYEEFVRMIIYK
jgi:calmodulin